MKYTLLGFKVLVYIALGYLLFFLATAYDPASSAYHPPFILFVVDTVNLFIHEAGHFFFRIFGMWISILGGSVFQILVPLALVFLTWREKAHGIALAGFWLGESLINVSVYIRDAPFRHLKLIAGGLIHDWNWLLADNLEAAEPLGVALFGMGLLICLASIVIGLRRAVMTFKGEDGGLVTG